MYVGFTSISWSCILIILVQTDFLRVYKGENNQVEHMLHI